MTAVPCRQHTLIADLTLTAQADASWEASTLVAGWTVQTCPVNRNLLQMTPRSSRVRAPVWSRNEVIDGRTEIFSRSSAPLSRCHLGGPSSGPDPTGRPYRPQNRGRYSK